MVADVAVDRRDAIVLMGMMRVGSTERAYYSRVPTIPCSRVISAVEVDALSSGGGAYCIRFPYAGSVHLYGAYWGRLVGGC
jgi:hypothetical protein